MPLLLTGLATAGLAMAEPVAGAAAPEGAGGMMAVADALPPTVPELPSPGPASSAARSSAIPEPMSLAVFGTGLLLLLRRRRF